jgi:hypothetical protein
MIELQDDELVFTFPDLRNQLRDRARAWIDGRFAAATSEQRARLPLTREELYSRFDWCLPRARVAVSFQRTLRIPDDGKDYPLPPGLGRFPVFHVDDYPGVPESWKKHGGVMMPMHRAEALWLSFSADYPMALKVAAGGICAVSGGRWSPVLQNPPQNYVVLPEQPWLDGFRVGSEVIRQFVTVPLGKGLTVEQQLTGEESWGGLQLQAFPVAIDKCWAERVEEMLEVRWNALITPPPTNREGVFLRTSAAKGDSDIYYCAAEAGLGAGGRMRQKITADPYGLEAWDISRTSRCYVHLCLADDWMRLTGTLPPHQPPTAKDYTRAGLPWFDYEDAKPAVEVKTALSNIKSVNTIIGEKTGLELADNASLDLANIVKLKSHSPRRVREY